MRRQRKRICRVAVVEHERCAWAVWVAVDRLSIRPVERAPETVGSAGRVDWCANQVLTQRVTASIPTLWRVLQEQRDRARRICRARTCADSVLTFDLPGTAGAMAGRAEYDTGLEIVIVGCWTI